MPHLLEVGPAGKLFVLPAGEDVVFGRFAERIESSTEVTVSRRHLKIRVELQQSHHVPICRFQPACKRLFLDFEPSAVPSVTLTNLSEKSATEVNQRKLAPLESISVKALNSDHSGKRSFCITRIFSYHRSATCIAQLRCGHVLMRLFFVPLLVCPSQLRSSSSLQQFQSRCARYGVQWFDQFPPITTGPAQSASTVSIVADLCVVTNSCRITEKIACAVMSSSFILQQSEFQAFFDDTSDSKQSIDSIPLTEPFRSKLQRLQVNSWTDPFFVTEPDLRLDWLYRLMPCTQKNIAIFITSMTSSLPLVSPSAFDPLVSYHGNFHNLKLTTRIPLTCMPMFPSILHDPFAIVPLSSTSRLTDCTVIITGAVLSNCSTISVPPSQRHHLFSTTFTHLISLLPELCSIFVIDRSLLDSSNSVALDVQREFAGSTVLDSDLFRALFSGLHVPLHTTLLKPAPQRPENSTSRNISTISAVTLDSIPAAPSDFELIGDFGQLSSNRKRRAAEPLMPLKSEAPGIRLDEPPPLLDQILHDQASQAPRVSHSSVDLEFGNVARKRKANAPVASLPDSNEFGQVKRVKVSAPAAAAERPLAPQPQFRESSRSSQPPAQQTKVSAESSLSQGLFSQHPWFAGQSEDSVEDDDSIGWITSTRIRDKIASQSQADQQQIQRVVPVEGKSKRFKKQATLSQRIGGLHLQPQVDGVESPDSFDASDDIFSGP